MREPIWLHRELAARVHAEQLATHGGQEGTRDPGMLDSALNRPKHTRAYGDPKPDLPALAASLGYGVARNHPLMDGNKRTAWVLCRAFLRINGEDIEATQAEIVSTVLALAAGELSEERFAEWLREHLVSHD
ncbi:MAG: type II toxin-antitoxin system death-on-curing family toxin [Planctomycetota bacterium]